MTVPLGPGCLRPFVTERWEPWLGWPGGATPLGPGDLRLVLARGGDPPKPPDGLRPRSFVTEPWPC